MRARATSAELHCNQCILIGSNTHSEYNMSISDHSNNPRWQNRQAKDDSGLVEQNLLALIFDILQLAALLFLTGGLLNPFSVLLLAPVVVSATMLRRRATLVLILTVGWPMHGCPGLRR